MSDDELIEETHLEQLLRLACGEPAHAPAFYDAFLQSVVHVLSTNTMVENADKEFPFLCWENPEDTSGIVLPCFTSRKMVQPSINILIETGILPDDVEVVGVDVAADQLMQMALNANVYFQINPFWHYSKIIFPDEAKNFFSDSPMARTQMNDGQIELFIPWPMPDDLIFSLTQLFTKHACIKKAFVLFLKNRVTFRNYYAVIIDASETDLTNVFAEAGQVAAGFEFETTPEPVMFLRLADSSYIQEFCISRTSPFYERSWGEKFILLEGGIA